MKNKWKQITKKCIVWMMLIALTANGFGISASAEETNGNAPAGAPEGPGGFPGGETQAADPIEGDLLDIVLTVGADESEVQVTWYSTSASGKLKAAKNDGEYAEYTAVSGESGYTAVFEEEEAETAAEEQIYYTHTVKLTDLEAGADYRYQVSGTDADGEEIWSEEYTYEVKDTSEKVEFLVVGDPQIGSSSTEDDAANWAVTMSDAVDRFPESSFVLSVGDQINSTRNDENKAEQNFLGFLGEGAQLSGLPIATSVGNHDNSHAQAYTSHFALPNVSEYGNTSDEVTGEEDYAFVQGNVLFMMLNTNNSSIAEHKAFIEETIAEYTDCMWRVVAFHQSIYSVARHVNDGNIADLRRGLSPVFAENGIDVVLMGHDHVYARSYIMGGETGMEAQVERTADDQALTEIINPKGVQYLTFNSASGSKYYDITQELFTYTAVQNQEKTPNYSHVVADETHFTVTTYRTTDQSVVDTVTLTKAEPTRTTAAEGEAEGFFNEEAELQITKTAGYDSGIVNGDGGSAEIIQYNSDTEMYYVVNGTSGTLDIVPRTVYTEDDQAEGYKYNLKEKLEAEVPDFVYGDMTSVAVNTEKDLVAVAVQAAGTNDNGRIVLLDYYQNIKAIIETGAQPDMVTFTEDGSKVLSANEGEPREGYGEGTTDPMGTVTVADLSNGTEQIQSINITFESWDEKREELTEAGVIIKKNTAPSVDFEPEYIAVNSAGTKAYVSLQEANAIAAIDLTSNTVTAVRSLGFKDHSLEENALDVLKKDGEVNIQTQPYLGIYMPDGISLYEVDGTEYLLTANEGDSREWRDYLNEIEEKVGESKSKVVFFDTSDYDGVDADRKYLFGGRSFSIYNAETMEQVYDSGSDFEAITAKVLPEYFNCSNDDKSFDDRSGKKGPEAESVVTGEINGKTYAFIGLERIGGIMIYDITDPAESKFVNYINSRDFSEDIAGDVSPEGLSFVSAKESYSGNAELFAAHEVSGTAAIYEIPVEHEVIRISGTDRYETAYEAAEVLKKELGTDKFDAVLVTTGKNFADALSGSYLASVKNAPILLTNGKEDNVEKLHNYIKENVKENGTVYILGGEAAVPKNVEGIEGYKVVRLYGTDRYETNLAILEEAGISEKELIVTTGKEFADSLSASAVKKPILLVNPETAVSDTQKAVAEKVQGGTIYVIGGEGAVSADVAAAFAEYAAVKRISGTSRYETSVAVANEFFEETYNAMVVSGENFPDGLCAGPLAAVMNVPLLLTADEKTDAAAEYIRVNEIKDGYVLGGTAVLPGETVKKVFVLTDIKES